jgi:hypothetical protein
VPLFDALLNYYALGLLYNFYELFFGFFRGLFCGLFGGLLRALFRGLMPFSSIFFLFDPRLFGERGFYRFIFWLYDSWLD